MDKFDRVTATFRPRRLDDLHPSALDAIGARCVWECLWIINEDDGGPYVGEFAMRPLNDCLHPRVWAPSGDLIDVEPFVERVFEPPKVTPIGNMNDLLAQVCAGDHEK